MADIETTDVAILWVGNNEYVAGELTPSENGKRCKRMWIAADGNGLNGRYDRIHVIMPSGNHLIFPAHKVNCWQVAGDKPVAVSPDFVQVRHPLTDRYTKINRATGTIVSTKQSPGPYKNIPIKD